MHINGSAEFYIFRMTEEIAKLKEEAEMLREEKLRCKMEFSFPSATY